VVYASTIWVYDGCNADSVDEESLLGLPRHPYTSQKIAGEMYCTSYAELYDVDYTILRFGIPYGPRARPAAVIPQFFKNALAGRPLTIAGGGKQSRRFTYVGDIARGVVDGLAPEARNRVYNLASEETVTILELATTVSDIVGDTDILHTPGRAGDFRGAEISSARIARELGREAGVEVVQVVEGTPAAEAGLRPEDLIVELDGAPVSDVGDIQRLMVVEKIGAPVGLRVLREGRELQLSIVPAELD
jgi:UDP-glucose 4-epimerase